jgi:hypothetical protein
MLFVSEEQLAHRCAACAVALSYSLEKLNCGSWLVFGGCRVQSVISTPLIQSRYYIFERLQHRSKSLSGRKVHFTVHSYCLIVYYKSSPVDTCSVKCNFCNSWQESIQLLASFFNYLHVMMLETGFRPK